VECLLFWHARAKTAGVRQKYTWKVDDVPETQLHPKKLTSNLEKDLKGEDGLWRGFKKKSSLSSTGQQGRASRRPSA